MKWVCPVNVKEFVRGRSPGDVNGKEGDLYEEGFIDGVSQVKEWGKSKKI